ncbi:MAG: DNA N-6-adenine-methyltransferase (Dam) [Betaproteobacteria bacterium ADurb.Bin341]|jgi:hypothetical protein|nr:MAG: DNA N-6-adenine-methyltransferase (Dam) [Betaproteobacteria bacterium ADurb.Bin341]
MTQLFDQFQVEKNGGMGGHQSARMKNDEWLTPPAIIEKLGTFDLDPCSPIKRPWSTASNHFTVEDDGLSRKWFGRVWMNPPYGAEAARWMERMADHGQGIALIFARTETSMFFDWVWPKASALLFIKGRLHFHYVDGRRADANSGAPSVLISYGEQDVITLSKCGIPGAFVDLRRPS